MKNEKENILEYFINYLMIFYFSIFVLKVYIYNMQIFWTAERDKKALGVFYDTN